MRSLLLALLALALLPVTGSAYVVQERGGLGSSTNGITLGPDGNLWAVEQGAGTVVRMKPDGTILGRYPVGDSPTSIANGPGNRVWVAVTGDDELVWFDATAATPSPNIVSTAAYSDCGPVAIEAGHNGRIYFSLPKDGCEADSKIGYTDDDGTLDGIQTTNNRGKAYDLLVSGGKLFVPDFDSNVIRRLALDDALTVESTTTVTGGGPDGITADSTGQIWVTLYSSGRVARFPGTQMNGSATESAPADGALVGPFGIVTGADGRVYVAGSESANLVRIDPLTNQSVAFAAPAGAKPWQIVVGPDEDLWFTDFGARRLLRFVSNKPRATTEPVQALAATAAALKAKVDPRGNATSVIFDYGTSPALGTTTAPVNVAEGVGPVDLQTAVGDLAPSTTYHVRVRATNAEGETPGAVTTFTTPAAPVVEQPPATPRRLLALPSFSWRVRRAYTRPTRVRATRLEGGETVRITCRGRGCKFKSRTFRGLGKGTRKFDRLFRRAKLRPRARVEMRITKAGTTGAVATATIRRGRKPKVVRGCLPPGTSKPAQC